jgi:hypothetical protein
MLLKRKKPPQLGLRRLVRESLILRCRLADRLLSARIPPPIGRKRPAEAARLKRKRQRQNVGDNNRRLQGVSIGVPDDAGGAGPRGFDGRRRCLSPFSLTAKQLALITDDTWGSAPHPFPDLDP